MENPLTKDEIQELNEIIKLPQEEQSIQLKEYFKKLTPEKIEFLKQFQTQQCVFCGISAGKVNSYKIYEDNETICVLDINPASNGHVLIIPKMHLKYTYDLPLKIFETTNLIVKRVKEVFGYDCNIFISNGPDAGEKFEHSVVNVIPRYKEDGINFNWKFNSTSEKQLSEIANKLKFEIKKKEEVKEIEERESKKIFRLP